MFGVWPFLVTFNLLFFPVAFQNDFVKLNQIENPPALICIDPGHGGEDPGAIVGKLTEAEQTLNIADRLKLLLEENNYKVVLTRQDNLTTLTNSQRAQICNQNKANLVVSIHLNYNDDPTFDYTQGFFGEDEKDSKFSEVVHDALVSKLNLADGGITDFGDNLLLKTQMPATLQETVFISSVGEYNSLSDSTGNRQQQIAQALFLGIDNWSKIR
jgi:N-acetylmuramoyl-L-alanine amidase